MINNSFLLTIVCSYCVIVEGFHSMQSTIKMMRLTSTILGRSWTSRRSVVVVFAKPPGENDDDNIVSPLLGMVMNRAMSTLAYSTTASSSSSSTEDSFAGRNMDNANNPALSVYTFKEEKDEEPQPLEKKKLSYLGNPNVTPTALAHTLWKNVIIPYEDTIIDATCGNGKDACALASMLFPSSSSSFESVVQPELLCMDIQKRACQNTHASLTQEVNAERQKYVRVLQTSHAPLPMPRSTKSVGLVCYNLGYLPSNTKNGDNDIITTQTASTLESISDAALLLRVGGLLSIMTYPGTNMEEANAVHQFCTGLAMFTTQDEGGWEEYIQQNHSEEKYYDTLTQTLEKVYDNGPPLQTWRVMDHRPLGRPLSPILITAMRIK